METIIELAISMKPFLWEAFNATSVLFGKIIIVVAIVCIGIYKAIKLADKKYP